MKRYYITWANNKTQKTGLFECRAKTMHHAINHIEKELGKEIQIIDIISFDLKGE